MKMTTIEAIETVTEIARDIVESHGASNESMVRARVASYSHWDSACKVLTAEQISDAIREGIVTAEDETTKPLVLCGKSIQYDKSGVGHCWVDATEDNCPPSIQEQIEAEIIDGKKKTSDGERFSNGQFYRWK